MKALVTGGGGFLGKAIVGGLQKCGFEVHSFSRSRHDELTALGIIQHSGSLADTGALSAAMEGSEVVFHVAAKPGIWGHYDEYHQTNVVGTQNVIAACREQQISKLVYSSSPSVVFNGRDMEGIDETVPYPAHYEAHYPRTKAMAEQMVRAANDSQLATVCLRPHLIWGPGDNHLLPRLVARARAGQLARIGSRANLIDSVYVDNAADAHLLAAERLAPGSPIAGKVYFISQGEPVPLWELVNRLLDAAGTPPVTRTVPTWLARLLATLMEATYKLMKINGEPRLTRFVVSELSTAHWFDIGAARRDLGYSPKVSLAEGLDRLKQVLQAGTVKSPEITLPH